MDMDIAINVDVLCETGDTVCGHSTSVVLNPVTQEVTHIVVKQKASPRAERLVPIDKVAESTPEHIRLNISENALATLPHFIENEFIRTSFPEYSADPIMMWAYELPETEFITLEHEQIPAGELAVRRGAQVEATDGHVGNVDAFLVDQTSEHITHLILREGHLWGHKEVSIPVSAIERMDEDTVYLSLDKDSIASLPSIPTRH